MIGGIVDFRYDKDQRMVEMDESYQREVELFGDDVCDLERYVNECTARNPVFPRLLEQARSRLESNCL